MASQIEGIAAQLEELQRRQRQQQEQHKELLEQRRKLAAELDAEKAVLRAMEGADPAGDSATPKCVRKTAARDDASLSTASLDGSLDEAVRSHISESEAGLDALFREANAAASAAGAEMDDVMGEELLRRAGDIERRMDAILRGSPVSDSGDEYAESDVPGSGELSAAAKSAHGGPASPPRPPEETEAIAVEARGDFMAKRDGLPMPPNIGGSLDDTDDDSWPPTSEEEHQVGDAQEDNPADVARA
jgi:hypothetical protein